MLKVTGYMLYVTGYSVRLVLLTVYSLELTVWRAHNLPVLTAHMLIPLKSENSY